MKCPTCERIFAVPLKAASNPPTLAAAPSPGTSCAPENRATSAQRGSISKLAIASLVLSMTFIGTLPGIVCGHLARRRFRDDPGFRGGGLALAGLIIGYAMLTLQLVTLSIMLLSFRRSIQAAASPDASVAMSAPLDAPRFVGKPGESPSVSAEFVALSGSKDWRTLKCRVTNSTERDIRQLDLLFTAFDEKQQRLSEFPMTKMVEPLLIEKRATQEMEVMAPFLSAAAKSVTIRVDGIGFTDGTEWRRNP